ncbi:coat protein [ssRNA phage SRR6960799_34]|uniref:Coat protein n=1 Tax=ssRNA phage SRR6960799_34 TaxID=2786592 RepID=A0A8S5L3N7_9VIRU|nr:coat protein [ssRNA phage SRR6960799_34]DAD52304.1 TPA_asm: coat protein [ssRNA phage SRR6960799_34]
MLADPQSITVNAVAQPLPATSRGVDVSTYMKDDGSYKLTIGHQYRAERNRFTVRIDAVKTAADPLASANNKIYSHSVYLVMDKPVVGYTNTEVAQVVAALAAWLTASSGANVTKVLGGET